MRVIEHRLKDIGSQILTTTVYDCGENNAEDPAALRRSAALIEQDARIFGSPGSSRLVGAMRARAAQLDNAADGDRGRSIGGVYV